MSDFNYYMSNLNKIAAISPETFNSQLFSNFVSAGYDFVTNEPLENFGALPILHCFLHQVREIATVNEFNEMLKDEELKKLFLAESLGQIICAFIIKDGVLVTNV